MYDIIGDLHSCSGELFELLEKLGYKYNKYYCVYEPPRGRKLILTGDIIDRGLYPVSAYRMVRDMIRADYAQMVRGNHDDKLMRWAKGNKVKKNNGLDKTVLALENEGIPSKEIFDFFKGVPYYLSLDNDKLIVVHAAWRQSMAKYHSFYKKCRTWALYGPTTGKILPNGFPDRIDWAAEREVNDDSPIVVYGHQAYKEPRIINKTYGIDGGCAFGGHLNCIKYPEMEIVQVKAMKKYCDHEGW
jgi:hypothetical protein